MRCLLDLNVDINATTEEGWTALHVAVENKQREAVVLKLKSGANYKKKNNARRIFAEVGTKETGAFCVQQIEVLEEEAMHKIQLIPQLMNRIQQLEQMLASNKPQS
jgi:ankyrin repeat protein